MAINQYENWKRGLKNQRFRVLGVYLTKFMGYFVQEIRAKYESD